MPYEVVDEPAGVYIRHFGFAAPFEVMEITRWEAENILNRHAYLIADLSEVSSDTVFSWTDAVLRALADDEAATLPEAYLARPFKFAFVCSNGKLKDVLKSFTEEGSRPNHQIRIFDTLRQARAWVATV